MATRLSRFSLLLAAAALLCACGAPAATPTASPTALPAPATPAPAAAQRASARDAALDYVRARYGAGAPPAGLAWTEQRATPSGLVGGEMYTYTAGDWLIALSYPVVMPELTVYTVKMANGATGFSWEGQVDAGGNVIEGEQLLLHALQVALTHAQAQYGGEAPPAGLPWASERITAAGMVGGETYRFTAGDWQVTITYPVVPPDQRVFNVTIQNPVTGFMWVGQVDANGNVLEAG